MADARFEQLKSKYASALAKVKELGIKVENLHVQDNKLFIKAHSKTSGDSNLVWDEIKKIEPNWQGELSANLTHEMDGPASNASPAAKERTYTVKAGDTLSKIAKEHFGEAKAYPRIFEANRDQLSDPDKIKPGQVLKIPPGANVS